MGKTERANIVLDFRKSDMFNIVNYYLLAYKELSFIKQSLFNVKGINFH